MAGKEGTAGVRCTSGETRRGAGFDRDTCSAGFCSVGGGHSNFFDFDGDEILAHLSLLIFSSVPGSGFFIQGNMSMDRVFIFPFFSVHSPPASFSIASMG